MSELILNLAFTLSGIFMLAGALGMFRFKDFYLKIHCATMITVGGVLFSLFLLMLSSDGAIRIKILALSSIIFLTSPVSTHFIALAAYKHGVKMNINGKVRQK